MTRDREHKTTPDAQDHARGDVQMDLGELTSGGHAVAGRNNTVDASTTIHHHYASVMPERARNALGQVWAIPLTRWLLVAFIPSVVLLGLYQLGVETHRARFVLIGLSGDTDLGYTAGQLVGLGLRVVVRLLWYMWAGLVTGMGIERWAGPVALALAGVPLVLLWRKRARTAFAACALALVVLGQGTVLYTDAVGIHHVAMAQGVDPWPCNPALNKTSVASIPERMRHEVCSWVRNDSDGKDKNDGRRVALGGLLGWMALAWVGLLFATWRSTNRCMAQARDRLAREGQRPWEAAAWKWAGRGLIAFEGVWLVFLLMHTPRAYAVSYFGLRYAKVTAVERSCDAPLHDALESREDGVFECNVVRLSAGAARELVIVNGIDCPDQPEDQTPRPRPRRLRRTADNQTPCIAPSDRSALITDQD